MGETNPSPNLKKPASVGRILVLVVPLAVVVIAVFVAYVFGGLPFVENFFKPALVDAKGIVYWNGEILKGGSIETKHETKGVRGASGFITTDGKFVLQTIVGGEFKDGAYAGKHKVTVRLPDRSVTMIFSQPPPASPEKYADFSTTDLEISVTRDASKNDVRLDLTGTGPKGQTNSKEETEKAAEAAAALAAQPKVTPEDMAKQILADNDKDKDGKLSSEEQGGVPSRYQRGITYVDLNKDGFLDAEEIRKMVSLE